MADVRELKDQAAKYFARGRFDRAVAAYEKLVRLEPRDSQLKVRLGDALIKRGEKKKAVKSYRLAAEAYAKDGFLPRAIAVCKLILEVDPSHVETQNVLAQLYARRSGRPLQPPAGSPAKPSVSTMPPSATPASVAPPSVPDTSGEVQQQEADVPAQETSAPQAPVFVPEPPRNVLDPSTLPELSLDPEDLPPELQVQQPAEAALPVSLELELDPSELLPADPGDFEMDEPLGGEEPPQAEASAPEPEAASEVEPAPATAAGTSAFTELELSAETEGGWFASPEETSFEPELPAGMTLGPPPAPPMSLAELEIARIDEEEEVEILTVAADLPVDAASLPEIPLFSDLSREAFIELASQCDLRRPGPGEVIVEEGSVGTSFFVLCSGTVRIVRKDDSAGEVTLARLSEGAFFGEMALLSGAPRAASVIAEDDVECLEISATLLAGLQKRYPHVGQVLKKFCRQRLLANVMATSPLFRPFGRDDRRALVEKFRARDVAEGEAIIEEGKLSDGLYVLMAGEVEVRKQQDGEPVTLARLKEGDLFGEISLLTKSAATATVAAATQSTVLRMPRASFDELISTHPQILMLVSELSDERLRIQQALESGTVQLDGDELMLV